MSQDAEDNLLDGSPSISLGSASSGVPGGGGSSLGIVSSPSPVHVRLVEGLKAASIKSVAVGGKHFACLSQGGELLVWGSGAQGQLGLGDCADAQSPKILRPVQGKAVHAVSPLLLDFTK